MKDRKLFDIILIVGILVALGTGIVKDYAIRNLHMQIQLIKVDQVETVENQIQITEILGRIINALDKKQKSTENRNSSII